MHDVSCPVFRAAVRVKTFKHAGRPVQTIEFLEQENKVLERLKCMTSILKMQTIVIDVGLVYLSDTSCKAQYKEKLTGI